MSTFGAVDLGASSGRVVLGRVGPAALEVSEVARFPNVPVRLPDGLHWNVLGLYRGVLDGLRAARSAVPISVGIDSWAVDYGLLDADGALLGIPYHYRDGRTDGVPERLWPVVSPEELYAITGIQFLPFNTLFQLLAGRPDAARTMLLIPDLIGYWLTGSVGAESTNASTTQLYDVRERRWSSTLAERVGIPPSLLPPLRQPGDVVGPLLPAVREEVGLPASVRLTCVGSHDTASAVAAVPAEGDRFAYISCGTWALVGVELTGPVLTEESRLANFTNEAGVFGTIRYLRNVMGLWLLQESLRCWEQAGLDVRLPALLREAASLPARRWTIDVDDAAFLPPGDMPARIASHCRERGDEPPADPVQTVRCIVDSLALAFAATVRQAQALADHEVDVVHMVGGGAHNELLCQLTADACGLYVVAGPTEATAVGNILVQAHAAGRVGDLRHIRRLVAATQPVRHYRPSRP
jgi:rhamnulokinase